MPIGGFGILTKGFSREIFHNYDTANTAITSSATANTFGSWVELITDVGDRDILILEVGIAIDPGLAGNDAIEVEIGIGAAASEVRRFGVTRQGSSIDDTTIIFPVNARIPASSRLSARTKDENSAAEDQRVFITYINL